MAQKVTIELADDIDGSEAAETVTFAVRGVHYELDLSEENTSNFDKALAPFVAHARRVPMARRSARRHGGTPEGIDPKHVRVWAAQRGIDLGMRGRIPYQVVDQYRSEA